ncbi:hypothetical protein EDD86DRAFT_46558 [Gorgonomyces haynaldii]|nr:hypothetical protein EDD86DRAFT_46558 [Gorgonomyces haynaldii]
MNCEIARPQVKGEGEVKPRKKRPQKKPQEAKPETKPETQKEPKKEKPVEKKPPQEKKPAPKPVERKERKPRDPGSVSETMIFVGNLPFKVTDEDLKQMFAEYSLKSARIVKGKFGRSKGFGFVDFASPADQKKAINDFSEATINERQLAVKAAYAEQAEE